MRTKIYRCENKSGLARKQINALLKEILNEIKAKVAKPDKLLKVDNPEPRAADPIVNIYIFIKAILSRLRKSFSTRI